MVGAGSSIPVANQKTHVDTELVVADQDFEQSMLISLPDMDYELDYGLLPDPVDIFEYYIVRTKSKTNPFKGICEWHSQLSKQLGGNYRKVIYEKRIRSRTRAKCRKPQIIPLSGIAWLIIVIAFMTMG